MDQEIERIYADYRNAADQLRKGSLSKVRPYLIVAGVIFLGGISSLLWAGVKTMANLIFWGIALSLVVEIVGIIVQTSWVKGEMEYLSRTRPGFGDFVKLFNRRWWPVTLEPGEKTDKFLAIIQRTNPG